MQIADISWMRQEYDALIRVADGLIEMIRACQACNILTFARMAQEAREAARKIASAIERILTPEQDAGNRAPVQKRGVFGLLRDAITRLAGVIAGDLAA